MSCEYLSEFSKKFETVLMEYSGAGGQLIHEKNQKQKSRDTVPLSKCNSKTTKPKSLPLSIYLLIDIAAFNLVLTTFPNSQTYEYEYVQKDTSLQCVVRRGGGGGSCRSVHRLSILISMQNLHKSLFIVHLHSKRK